MARYKTEEYGGRKVVFVKGKGGMVFSQTPSISKQYIGVGRTKLQAFEEAKKVIDNFNRVNKQIEESKSMLCKIEDLNEMDGTNFVEQYKVKGKVLRVYQDTDGSEGPREWDNLGKMYCWHKRYNLGDEKLPTDSYGGWDEIKKYLIKEKGAIPDSILPLYLYDHSGITMRTTPFGDRWDSGQVGFIYTTEAKLKEMGSPKTRMKDILRGEVKVYDQYLTGDVYGFKLFECKAGNWEETDAVWGFYGSDAKESGIFDSTGIKGWRRF